ncbi:hypothetical protein KIN20_021977 [Parelaphostrongylus tenuis]|uniref:Uncharacterized protein n=1 Tax=Parelaphostrongylus tenuis TaxID=148309 RepID=A0AAD5N5R3_PARTN|nr:hypothetical protein KIN20_021977 [Parelaphostrongylus tenuis]
MGLNQYFVYVDRLLEVLLPWYSLVENLILTVLLALEKKISPVASIFILTSIHGKRENTTSRIVLLFTEFISIQLQKLIYNLTYNYDNNLSESLGSKLDSGGDDPCCETSTIGEKTENRLDFAKSRWLEKKELTTISPLSGISGNKAMNPGPVNARSVLLKKLLLKD